MTIGRRGFLMAGGAAAGAGILPVPHADAASIGGGRSVTDFGVEPNSEADQTKALQKAIDEISRSGHAVYIPGGLYLVEGLKLPPKCAISGDPGLAVLRCRLGATMIASSENQDLRLSGLIFDSSADGQRVDLKTYLIVVMRGNLSLSHCSLRNEAGAAVFAENISGLLVANSFNNCNYGALSMSKARDLSISQCRFEGCKHPDSLSANSILADGEGVLISGNHISQCTGGICLAGSGIVNANYVSGVERSALWLGGRGEEKGSILATSNNLSDCRIGIGVSASGEAIFASLNMIRGAKDGAIRAFDGDKLVGPDLVQESSEAYLNLTLAGNVAR